MLDLSPPPLQNRDQIPRVSLPRNLQLTTTAYHCASNSAKILWLELDNLSEVPSSDQMVSPPKHLPDILRSSPNLSHWAGGDLGLG